MDQDPAAQYTNGYLFQQYMRQGSVEQAGPSYQVQEPPNANQYQQFPYFPRGGQLQFVPVSRPCSPADSASTSGSSPRESTKSKSKRCSWSNPEVKCLILAYKEHHDLLKTTRSAHGKKGIWESIMNEFIGLCREAGIETAKTLAQIKEKWRGIFDKYKAVNYNNNRTGRDRKTCEFYDDIDEFMAGSDKVNPIFVKQTKLKKTCSEEESSGNGDAATADPTAETEPGEDDDTKHKQPNEKNSPTSPGRKKRKMSSVYSTDTEDAILYMFQAQQSAIERSEEKDERMLQALIKSQEDVQRRHQEFTVAVLGKLGDIFASKIYMLYLVNICKL